MVNVLRHYQMQDVIAAGADALVACDGHIERSQRLQRAFIASDYYLKAIWMAVTPTLPNFVAGLQDQVGWL